MATRISVTPPLAPQYSTIKALKATTFRWDDDSTNKVYTEFLVADVMPAVPEAVLQSGMTLTDKRTDPSLMIPRVVLALQETMVRLEAAQAKIVLLEKQMLAVQNRLASSRNGGLPMQAWTSAYVRVDS